jgi:dihydrofolate synthase / folylpolyglutamate synthase
VKRFMDWQGVRLTSFEFLSATAFFAFRAARVDYAVIEVGVGGRQDATNVIAPDVALITNVDYDHMDVLGHTLEAIAAEKAGIIKPFTPIVCGTMPDGPRDVVLARAKALQAPVLQIGRDYDVADYRRSDFSGRCNVRVGDRFWSDVPLSSPAGFVATNAAHALAVYEVLSCRGLVPDLDAAMVRAVFQRVDLSHSCEVVPGEPMVLLDGSHNAPAAANLAAVLRHTCEGRRTVLLVSLAADKDYRTMLKHLAEAGVDRAVFTHYPEQGTVEPQHLADGWRPWSQAAAEIVAAPDRAFARARQAAGPRGVVVVTGSTHLAAYCRSLLHSVVPEALPAV